MLTGTSSSATAKYTYGDNIEIKYTATVNENAVNVVSENYAELIYSNNPNDSTKTGKTPPEIEKVFSAKVKIEKVDGDTKQINPQTSAVSYSKHLKGAKFVLKCVSKADNASSSDAGKYYYYDSTNDTVTWVTVAAADQTAEKLKDNTDLTIAITDDDGFADDVFIGLENGQYQLIEVEAPKGYNLLQSPTAVTINGTNAGANLVIESVVENNQGTELPETGGIGTTIFYIAGIVLVLGAAAVIIARRKAEQN